MRNDEMYSIMMYANLDTSRAQESMQKILKEFKKEREITTSVKIDGQDALKTVTTYVNNLGKAIERTTLIAENGKGKILSDAFTKVKDTFKELNFEAIKTSSSFEKFKDANGDTVSVMRETDSKGNVLKTTIRETGDVINGITKKIEVYDETNKKLISTHEEVIKDQIKSQEELKKQNLETQKATELAEKQALKEKELAQAEKERMQNTSIMTTQTNEMYKGYSALITTTKELNSKGEILSTVTREYTDSAGYAVKETDKFDASGKKVQGTVTEMSKGLQTAKQGFSDIIAKVTKFYLATLPIQMVRKALSEAVTTVKEFDEAVTELQKVSNLNGESLDAYTEKLSKLGSEVARTTTEMVDMATNMKKAGFSDEDSAILAQLAGLYQNTADEELSASEATSVLVSQMKAFNYTANDAMHITDAINKVSQEFAVSSGDIGKGLTQAGASLSTYGNSFDETIGLITAGEYFLPVTDLIDGNGEVVTPFCNILILWKPNALHTNLSW